MTLSGLRFERANLLTYVAELRYSPKSRLPDARFKVEQAYRDIVVCAECVVYPIVKVTGARTKVNFLLSLTTCHISSLEAVR
jgi:hypothetical protein